MAQTCNVAVDISGLAHFDANVPFITKITTAATIVNEETYFFTNVKKSFKKWFVSFLFLKNAEENYIGLWVVALCFFIEFSRAIS